MKSGFIRQNLGVLVLILLFTNVSLILGEDPFLEPVSTAITNLSWSKNNDLGLDENYTFFDFIFDFEISNPNENPVTFGLPDISLAFLPNISIIFDDETLEYFPPGYLGICVPGEITVDPGITSESKSCFISIKEKGLKELPNGIYTIWIYLHSNPEIICNETIITITDDQTIINFGTLESVIISLPTIGLMIFGGIILVFANIIRKKNLRKK